MFKATGDTLSHDLYNLLKKSCLWCVGRKCQSSSSLSKHVGFRIHTLLASIVLYLLTVLKNPRFAIELRLLFRICLAKVIIGICLVFRVVGCAMVVCLGLRDCKMPFLWFAIVNCLSNRDWLFVLGHEMVIRPIRLVLRDFDLLVGCLAKCIYLLPV